MNISCVIYDKFKVQFPFLPCWLRRYFLQFFFKLYDILIMIFVSTWYFYTSFVYLFESMLTIFTPLVITQAFGYNLNLFSWSVNPLATISIHSRDLFYIHTTLLVLMHLPKPYLVGNLKKKKSSFKNFPTQFQWYFFFFRIFQILVENLKLNHRCNMQDL